MKITDISLGDKVRLEGEKTFGTVFEILSATNEVAARYDNGDEYDVAVDTIAEHVKPAKPASQPTTKTPPPVQPAPQGPITATVRPKWSGQGRPPVGSLVEIYASKLKDGVQKRRFAGKVLRVVNVTAKRVHIETEEGQKLSTVVESIYPSQGTFTPVDKTNRIRTGVIVTFENAGKYGFTKNRLWVVVGATKNRVNQFNIAPLDPPEHFEESHIYGVGSHQLTVRHFEGLVVPE